MTNVRRIGETNLEITPLVLGGNVFGWTADRQASFAVLDAFVANGGTLIDTADLYSAWVPGNSGGESETMIGEWLRQRGRRDDVLILSKVGVLPGPGGKGLAPERIEAALDISLKRLGVDYLDFYFAHMDDPSQPQEEVAETFGRLVKAGKVRVLGASNFSPQRFKSAVETAKSAGLPYYQVLQPEYNLVSRETFEGEMQDYCVANNIAAMPYYALARGYLTGKYRSAADLSKSARGEHLAKLVLDEDSRGPRVLAALDATAEETGATQAQVSLAWLLAQPSVVAPIASATSPAQLDELMPAITLALSADQLRRLDEASRVS